MIVFDKSVEVNDVVVTITENTTTIAPTLSIRLYSHFSKKEYQFELGPNHSTHPGRYDLFKVSREAFTDIEDGFYLYNIVQLINPDTSLETGMAYIKSPSATTIIKNETAGQDDDLIIYNG